MSAESELPAPDAGSQPSIEERVARSMGLTDDEPTPDQAPQESDQPETEASAESTGDPGSEFDEIEFDGSRYQVPKPLKDAFMHKSDYTRKTQELANQRRETEALQSQLKVAQLEREFYSSVTQEAQTIQMIDAQTKELTDNWASLSADQKQDLMLLDRRRAELVNAIQGKQGEFQHKHQSAMQELERQAADVISKSIPGWNEKVKGEIMSHAKGDGYTEVELSSIIDPRHAKTLYKAMMFDQLQAKAKPITKLSPTAQAQSTRPMPSATKDKLGFMKAVKATESDPLARKKVVEDRIGKIFGG